MGTAFELTGDDASALKWINEGMRRNPDSHMWAEWLRSCILEAKLALKKDPAWLDAHCILPVEPKQLADPNFNFPTAQGKKDYRGVIDALKSQRVVRALFIKRKDPVVNRTPLDRNPASLEPVLPRVSEAAAAPAAGDCWSAGGGGCWLAC